MHTEHEGIHYKWNYDSLMGVGNFQRKSDDLVSLLETGSDCVSIRRDFNRLRTKTESKNYPKNAPSFESIFDSIASEYTFD